MTLPNAERAIVPWSKVVAYLLSPTHPRGRHKARFFARFGFAQDRYDVFAAALREHAMRSDVVEVTDTPLGTRYTVEGPIVSPDGRNPNVRVVWFTERGEAVPTLVTAYPLQKREYP